MITRMQWNRLATIGVLSALGALSSTAVAADVCFTDTMLDIPNDYQFTLHLFGNGGTCTTTPVATGGNPGQYLQVDTTVSNAPTSNDRSGVVGTFLFNSAVYDPSVDGRIYRICYEEWAARLQGVGDVQGTGPMCRQVDAAGNVVDYRALPSLIVGVTNSWERRARTFVETDFVAIDVTNTLSGVDTTRHPDFSSQGQPIEFGFFRTNNTSIGGSGYARSAGIDSWSITIVHECEGDADHDGIVGFLDILFVLANWGRVCP